MAAGGYKMAGEGYKMEDGGCRLWAGVLSAAEKVGQQRATLPRKKHPAPGSQMKTKRLPSTIRGELPNTQNSPGPARRGPQP